MVFMLILSHSIVLLCKFTPPLEFSKFSGRKMHFEGYFFLYPNTKLLGKSFAKQKTTYEF